MSSSRQFWQRRRAQRRLPRLRSANMAHGEPKATGIIGFKAGMMQLTVIDDSESPTKQREINRAVTIIEIPKIEVYGIRLYKRDKVSGYIESAGEILAPDVAQRAGAKNTQKSKKADSVNIEEYDDVSLLAVAFPKTTNTQQNHIQRFEIKVAGKDTKSKMGFCSTMLGKELKAEEVFKAGQYVDVVSITKGHGWQGVIKRFGVQRQDHKASQKIRHVGTLGAYSQAKVMYTVPQAGQMGFHYRTEKNKRVLKISGASDASAVNKKSGFKNYGAVRGNFIVIDGSIPGPAHRLVRIKGSMSSMSSATVKEPKIGQIIK